MGYLGGVVDIVVGRLVEAVLALPLVIVAFLFVVALGPSPLTVIIVVIGLVFTPLIARTVRSAVLVESQLDYLASARLLGENGAVHHVRRDPAERVADDPGRVHGAAGVRHLHRRRRCRSSASASSRRPRTGARTSPRTTACSPAGYWWMTLFPALAIASLVIAINLVTDSIEQVLAS